jgi:hypothetical protein
VVKDAFTHWGTATDALALRLPSHDGGTGLGGRSLGTAQRGGEFVFDVFQAYEAGLISNPNAAIAGAIGLGKSTVVKMLLDRGLRAGRSAVVLDPKGEYGDLASAHGGRVVTLGRGNDVWCNPFGTLDSSDRALVYGLVATAQGCALSNEQRYQLDEEWRTLRSASSTRLLRALFERFQDELTSEKNLARRTLAFALYRFVEGDLAGIFDGPGEPVRFDQQLVVLDLSAVWATATMAVATVASIAAAQRVLERDAKGGYLVVDEAWSVLADEHASSWLHGSWKLARARGIAHVLVLHRWSDVEGTGDEGTMQRARSVSLLRDCETVFLFRQPHDELLALNVALYFTPLEMNYVRQLPKGVALVRYGRHRSIVRVVPDAGDRCFIDTDEAMRELA